MNTTRIETLTIAFRADRTYYDSEGRPQDVFGIYNVTRNLWQGFRHFTNYDEAVCALLSYESRYVVRDPGNDEPGLLSEIRSTATIGPEKLSRMFRL